MWNLLTSVSRWRAQCSFIKNPPCRHDKSNIGLYFAGFREQLLLTESSIHWKVMQSGLRISEKCTTTSCTDDDIQCSISNLSTPWNRKTFQVQIKVLYGGDISKGNGFFDDQFNKSVFSLTLVGYLGENMTSDDKKWRVLKNCAVSIFQF